MKLNDAKKLRNGLYEIHWKQSEGGGSSLAAVGRTENGTPWLAPCNWINGLDGKETGKVWRSVESVKVIRADV